METIENLQKKYETYCIEHWETMNEGNSKKANQIHKKIIRLVKNAEKDNQMDAFIPFLENNNEHIRLRTADFFLETNPELALKVLYELLNSTNFFISAIAESTINLYIKNQQSTFKKIRIQLFLNAIKLICRCKYRRKSL